jgi:hypothetical protein
MLRIGSRASPYLCAQNEGGKEATIREKSRVNNADSPGRKNDGICVERAPIRKLQAVRHETGYLGVILEFNLPIDYQLARADICASRPSIGSVTYQKSGA